MTSTYHLAGLFRLASLFVLTMCATFLPGGGAQAAGAPENLRNKSFAVSWTENRESRAGSEGAFRQVSIAVRMSIYVSSIGRPFSKLSVTSRGDSASHGSVGQSGSSLGKGSRTVSFSASSIVVQSNFGGAARRVVINSSGSGCSAEVVVGKLQGAATVGFTRTDGRSFEIRSMSASSASCQASDGNIFSM